MANAEKLDETEVKITTPSDTSNSNGVLSIDTNGNAQATANVDTLTLLAVDGEQNEKKTSQVIRDANASEASKPNSTTKLELRSKEELIQLIKRQLTLLKEARKTSAQYKEEASTLKEQVAEFESKLQKNSASLNDVAIQKLELSDYKKSMETLRKKLESADKTIAEKDESQRELGQKLHSLTERNIELEELVERETKEKEATIKKMNDLEQAIAKMQCDFDSEKSELEERITMIAKETDDMRETIKRQKKELNAIRNEDNDQKNELNRFVKSNEQIQRKYDELFAEFTAYKEKAEFVLRQNEEERKEKSRDKNFEMVELNRQLKLKSDHISQLTDKFTGAQQEINSLQERCRLLRSELDDARQSIGAIQKENRNERKQLICEHEQKTRQLIKESEENKKEILQLREQNVADRRSQSEMMARSSSEFASQLQELRTQLARLQTPDNADTMSNNQEHQQKMSISPKKKTSMATVRPLNFDVESHFTTHDMNEAQTSKSDNRHEMMSSLNELINGEDEMPTEGRNLSTSMSSLNSWVEPDQLEAQLRHTREILHEIEENNSKLEAQNRLLKEEIRRSERNNKCAQHLGSNMQYFKNVMLTFIKQEKVNDGRMQLLPILSTMLGLSPEEMKSVEEALQQQQREREAAANQSAEYAGYLGFFH
ncbi:GRIP domain protein [Aphelenchoides besseyi]|nr:GRIP domain protein [Aphelenchoides besseyi]